MGGYVHPPDLGELLEVTAYRPRIVSETIWQVVTKHPHTAVGKAGR